MEVAEEAKRQNFPVSVFPCNGKLDLKTIYLIKQFLSKQEIDIIHTHGYKSNLYALAASLGKQVSRITTCHNWLGDDPKMRLYAWLDKFFLNRFDRVIAVSDPVKQEIINHNISAAKVLTIYNGIDTDRFNGQGKADSVRKEFSIEKDCKVIGTVGRLSEEKGHVLLMQAAEKILQEYPKVVFLIVGDGPLKRHLEAKADQLAKIEFTKTGCSKAHFVFPGVRNDMPTIYSLVDIFVLPSLTEGLPMVLLEAMAAQKPVVATKVGAVPRVIEDGHSGLLIQPGDVNALFKAIVELLKNPQKAYHLAQHAHQKVKSHFSSKRMAERYMEVYKDVLKINRRLPRLNSCNTI